MEMPMFLALVVALLQGRRIYTKWLMAGQGMDRIITNHTLAVLKKPTISAPDQQKVLLQVNLR